MRLSRKFAIPILYVSHALDEIVALATHLVVLEDGRVLAAGEMKTLLARKDLQSHFGRAHCATEMRRMSE
jgi:molybdate transport system ATP-binding protein